MEVEELLPCPFCGGECEIVRIDVEPQGDPWYGSQMETFPKCKKCNACLFDQYFHDGFSSAEDAAKAWNTRYNASPLDS